MHYSQKVLSLVAVALLSAGPVLAQQAKTSSIGLVDREKILSNYKKAEQAANDFKTAQDRVQKLIEDSQKQYDEAKTAKKPPAELEALQKRLQTTLDEEMKKLSAKAQALETQLETDVDTAIKAEATARKLDTVILKQAVLLGGVDITDSVLKRLTTATPAATGASGNSATK